jgi:ligand-binding sensor protein
MTAAGSVDIDVPAVVASHHAGRLRAGTVVNVKVVDDQIREYVSIAHTRCTHMVAASTSSTTIFSFGVVIFIGGVAKTYRTQSEAIVEHVTVVGL